MMHVSSNTVRVKVLSSSRTEIDSKEVIAKEEDSEKENLLSSKV